LLAQLESEGILADEPVTDSGAIVQIVHFTFERYSDHRIAKQLLDRHFDTGKVLRAGNTTERISQQRNGL